MFLWGSKTKGLAFAYISLFPKGSVYATIESQKSSRSLTLSGQYATTNDRLLYPLVSVENVVRLLRGSLRQR